MIPGQYSRANDRRAHILCVLVNREVCALLTNAVISGAITS